MLAYDSSYYAWVTSQERKNVAWEGVNNPHTSSPILRPCSFPPLSFSRIKKCSLGAQVKMWKNLWKNSVYSLQLTHFYYPELFKPRFSSNLIVISSFPTHRPSAPQFPVRSLELSNMDVKSWKIICTKLAQQAANGPAWMPQALKPLLSMTYSVNWCVPYLI